MGIVEIPARIELAYYVTLGTIVILIILIWRKSRLQN